MCMMNPARKFGPSTNLTAIAFAIEEQWRRVYTVI